MERESFEDDEVADILNKYFVSIKVDREERPDIDNIYMTVCQTLTGSGGWPLTVILTPEKKPFYSGTYFPKKSKYGRPGLMDILYSVKEAWESKRSELIESSEQIIDAVRDLDLAHSKSDIGVETIHKAYVEFKHFFDSDFGGFGSAPKFPTPHNLSFLLRYNSIYNKNESLDMVEETLESMYEGGIFDHIGFGFSRYSTDRVWLVPHFEKMLYDNALLSIAYIEAYQVTNRRLYKKAAEDIFTYILRDMTSREGGFYSAEDADSEGVEGKFYVWTVDEVKSVLGEEDGALYCKYYNISNKGNFEGKNIANLIETGIREIEESKELCSKLDGLRRKLFDYREKRIHPYKDDKILTSWNGLMIAAMAYGGRAFNNKKHINAAQKAADFIENKLIREDGRLLARYRDEQSAYPGYLDDYAFMIWGLIELYEATFETSYLNRALSLNEDMLKLFWDDKNGGLFIYGNDSEELITRPKDIYDGAMPSGNSVAALDMLRLSRITGNLELEEKADTIFNSFGGSVEKHPNSYSFFLMALLYRKTPTRELVIAANKDEHDLSQVLNIVNGHFAPFSTVVLNTGNENLYEIVPFIRDQKVIEDKPTVYICENFACSKPIIDLDELEQRMRTRTSDK